MKLHVVKSHPKTVSPPTDQCAAGQRDYLHLTRELEQACRSAQRPEFSLTDEYRRRQAGRALFSPSLAYGRHFGAPLPTARAAAVMILIEPHDGQWVIPLTVRPNHLPDHPGQVCLPGGRVEAGESLEQAAEREFCEELGMELFPARTLGALQSLYVYNSDFYLTPYVAVSPVAHRYSPCTEEVESLVYLSLDSLLDFERRVMRAHARGLVSWTAPGIDLGVAHLWGATAIVLGELAAILRASQ